MKIYRQGDIYLTPVNEPVGVQDELKHVTLAEGEVTGHSHRVADPATANLFVGTDGRTYMRVVAATDIIHQEHGTITIEPGLYRYWRQVEYTPQGLREVWD